MNRWDKQRLGYVQADLLALQEFADIAERHQPKLKRALAHIKEMLDEAFEVQSTQGEKTTAMATKKKATKKKSRMDDYHDRKKKTADKGAIPIGRQHVHESQPQGATTGGAGGSAQDAVTSQQGEEELEKRNPEAAAEEDQELEPGAGQGMDIEEDMEGEGGDGPQGMEGKS